MRDNLTQCNLVMSTYNNQVMNTHFPTLENPTRRNLQRLFLLRSVMIAFMLAATLALYYLHIPLPKIPIALAVGGMLLLN